VITESFTELSSAVMRYKGRLARSNLIMDDLRVDQKTITLILEYAIYGDFIIVPIYNEFYYFRRILSYPLL